MIIRFFKFLALLWYADEHGWPEAKAEEERHSPPGRSAPSIGALHGSAWLPKEQGSET